MTSYFNACDVTVANSNHKDFLCFFDVHLCPHFEKGSATYGLKLAANQGMVISVFCGMHAAALLEAA